MKNSFIKLLLSQLFANFADIFFRVAIIVNVYVISKSVIITSIVPVLIGVSSFVASFLVPLTTRRFPLNKVLFFTQFGKTILLGLLIVIFTHFQFVPIVVLYIFVVSISILDGFATPVSHSLIPHYAKDLGKANSALSMSSETAQLVGWGLGGLLFATIGILPTIIITLILYMISTSIILYLPNIKIERKDLENNIDILLKGWRLVATESKIRLFIQTNLLETLSNTIWVSSIILVFVTKILQKTESYWGYANTTYSIGIILAGLLVFKSSKIFLANKGKSIIFSLIAMAIITVFVVIMPNVSTFLIFSALIGFLSQLKEVPQSMFLQESIDKNDLINVYSVFEVISTLSFSGFVLFMGYFTEKFGINTSFYLSAACLILESILIYYKRDYLK